MRHQLVAAQDVLGNPRRGGVMLVPGIAPSIEEWEQEATASQARLIAEAREDPQHVVTEPAPVMTAEQERSFQQETETLRRQHKPLTEEQKAAIAYTRAMGLYR